LVRAWLKRQQWWGRHSCLPHRRINNARVNNAALDANRKLDALQAEVQTMLSEAHSVDKQEDSLFGPDKRGDELPNEVADKDQKANTTEPGSRIMKTRKGYVQGYNAQAMATEEQIIIAADVTQEENDQKQFKPMIQQAKANLAAVKVVLTLGAVLMDAGYCSDENLQAADELGVDLYCATKKDHKQRKEAHEAPPPRGRIPKNLTAREKMERKLRTKKGRAMYKKRRKTIEPVFGQIKTVQDGGRCMRRGLKANRSEWEFTCSAHNLLKLWREILSNVVDERT
jgi:hypothetical protein